MSATGVVSLQSSTDDMSKVVSKDCVPIAGDSVGTQSSSISSGHVTNSELCSSGEKKAENGNDAPSPSCVPDGTVSFNSVPDVVDEAPLTDPSNGVHNLGHDNENHDLILKKNCFLVDTDSETKIETKYQILRLLGQGTFGQVVMCLDVSTDNRVAIKVIKNLPAYRQQAKTEVGILKLLNSSFDKNDEKHIVRMLTSFVFQNHLCIVFELLERNLFEVIRRMNYTGFPRAMVQRITKQLLETLMVLEEAKIIHCDLKPENILIQKFQGDVVDVKLIDFGSACDENRTVYTYIQSRFYRAPEVLLGHPYSRAIDLWSLGCVSAELFLGLPVFPGASDYDLIQRMMETLGCQPPNQLLMASKHTMKFFGCASSWEGPAFTLLTPEQYMVKEGRAPVFGKNYFKKAQLQDLILRYNSRRGSPPTPYEEGELEWRHAFVHFVTGLLQFDPQKRWTAWQAYQHPLIQKGDFISEPFDRQWCPPPLPAKLPQVFFPGSSQKYSTAGTSSAGPAIDRAQSAPSRESQFPASPGTIWKAWGSHQPHLQHQYQYQYQYQYPASSTPLVRPPPPSQPHFPHPMGSGFSYGSSWGSHPSSPSSGGVLTPTTYHQYSPYYASPLGTAEPYAQEDPSLQGYSPTQGGYSGFTGVQDHQNTQQSASSAPSGPNWSPIGARGSQRRGSGVSVPEPLAGAKLKRGVSVVKGGRVQGKAQGMSTQVQVWADTVAGEPTGSPPDAVEVESEEGCFPQGLEVEHQAEGVPGGSTPAGPTAQGPHHQQQETEPSSPRGLYRQVPALNPGLYPTGVYQPPPAPYFPADSLAHQAAVQMFVQQQWAQQPFLNPNPSLGYSHGTLNPSNPYQGQQGGGGLQRSSYSGDYAYVVEGFRNQLGRSYSGEVGYGGVHPQGASPSGSLAGSPNQRGSGFTSGHRRGGGQLQQGMSPTNGRLPPAGPSRRSERTGK